MKRISRREFIVSGVAFLATIGLGSSSWFRNPISTFIDEWGEHRPDPKSTVLVVIQLSGGNDGINTLIPWGQGAYYDARPTLAIGQKEVLPLGNSVGLHPNLVQLHRLFEQGKLAVIQGVGYPKPDRSHFRSMEIWQTAVPEKIVHSGWLARYAETSLAKDPYPLKLVTVGSGTSKAFLSESLQVPSIQSLDSFRLFDPKRSAPELNRLNQAFLDMYAPNRQAEQVRVTSAFGRGAYDSAQALLSLTGSYINKVQYPNSAFARDLQLVAKLLAGGSRTRVFYVQLGGFDDHEKEKEQHAKLLKDLDDGVGAFYADLEQQGLADKVVSVAFSEFGRRVKENGSGGTDHGTAAPVLVWGGRVKGGLYGEYPSLTKLDNGDLYYSVDFRSVYGTLLDQWLGGDSKEVLGGNFEKLGFI